MYLSPFSTPYKYTAPDGKGIYTTHAPHQLPPRPDGTPGAIVERALIDTEGEVKSSPRLQLAGNISWWGPYITDEFPEKGRHVLSYAGPKLRYFLDPSFTYGTEISHNEVYYKGGAVGVAPGPVLGAALRYMDYFDPMTLTTAPEWFLIVIAYVGGEDVLYKKRLGATITTASKEKLTDELRVASMVPYHAQSAPKGWLRIGAFPRQGTSFYPPETPWFFNESGTEAVCMRRESFSFSNGGSTVTEDVLHRFKVGVSAGVGSFSNNGNLPPYQHEEYYKMQRLPDFTEVPHPPGTQHLWKEEKIDVTIAITGSQYVLCDFVGDVAWYGTLEYNGWRGHTQQFLEGIDAPDASRWVNTGLQATTSTTYPGSSEHYAQNAVYVPASVPYAVGDHRPSAFFGSAADIRLHLGPISAPETDSIQLFLQDSGTSDEFDGYPQQPDNPWFYYYRFWTIAARGALDLRKLLLLTSDSYVYATAYGYPTMRRVAKYGTRVYTSDNYDGELLSSVVTPQTSGVFNYGWSWAQHDTWAGEFEQTLTRNTYNGTWATDNFTGASQQPGSKTFYAADQLGDMSTGWPLLPDMLYGAVPSACSGNGVMTEHGAWAVDVEVPTIEGGGNYVLVSRTSWGGDVPTYTNFSSPAYLLGVC